jgi:hypothetical protein
LVTAAASAAPAVSQPSAEPRALNAILDAHLRSAGDGCDGGGGDSTKTGDFDFDLAGMLCFVSEIA